MQRGKRTLTMQDFIGHYKSFGCYSGEPQAGLLLFCFFCLFCFHFRFLLLLEEQNDLIYIFKESL